MEEFKDIPGHEGRYKINKYGQVFSCRSNKILKNQINARGYSCIGLYVQKSGKNKSLEIHRALAMVFIGEPNGREVNHKNGIKTDHRLENLEYCTRQENAQHSYDTGLRKPSKRLSQEQELMVMDLRKCGKLLRELAKQFDTCEATIHNIIKRLTNGSEP